MEYLMILKIKRREYKKFWTESNYKTWQRKNYKKQRMWIRMQRLRKNDEINRFFIYIINILNKIGYIISNIIIFHLISQFV